MSTKIYCSYRCSVNVFYKTFLPTFRKHCFDSISVQVEKLIHKIPESRLLEIYHDKGWEEKHTFAEFVEQRGLFTRIRETFKKAVEASRSKYRDPVWCLDCSFNAWFYKGKAYILPNGERWIFEDYKMPTGVSDYNYWNNTDGPEEIPYSEWKKRGKTWDNICLLNNWDDNRLHHTIFAPAEVNSPGVTEISKNFLPENGTPSYHDVTWGLTS